jgi:hypothetical protein
MFGFGIVGGWRTCSPRVFSRVAMQLNARIVSKIRRFMERLFFGIKYTEVVAARRSEAVFG